MNLANRRISAKRDTYAVAAELPSASVTATMYPCTITTRRNIQAILKVAQTHTANPLLQNEVRILDKLWGATRRRQNLQVFGQFLPVLIENFELPQPDGKRQVNVFQFKSGWMNLWEVGNRFTTAGTVLPPKQMAWMLRRLLSVIAFSYGQGIMHGAVTPTNVLINTAPKAHELNLINWDFAVWNPAQSGERIDNLPWTEYVDWYPDWVFDIEGPQPLMDVSMTLRSMIYALGGNPLTGQLSVHDNLEPPEVWEGLQSFFEEVIESGDHNLTAANVLQQFSTLISGFWGPPRFIDFQLPA